MSKDTFIAQYQEAADRAAKELGTSSNVLLAQWGLETGWGKSVIPGTNNLGNIKDFSGGGVAAKDNQTGSTDRYRQYATANDFADDFTRLIKKRYPKAVGQTTAHGFASALKAGGYAEDPDYAAKVAASAGEALPTARQVDNAVASPEAFYGRLAAETASMIARPDPGWQARADRQRLQDYENTKLRAESDPNALEMLGAGMDRATTGAIVAGVQELIYGPKFAKQEGYSVDWAKAPQNTDSDLMEQLARSKSQAETDHVMAKYDEEQFRIQTVMSRGKEKGIALSFAAEVVDPINWLVPAAAARGLAVAGRGSLALAQQGRMGAALGAAVTENLLSGTAVEAVRQTVTGKFDATNLAVSLVADSFMGVAAGAFTVRGARAAAALAEADRVTQKAATSLLDNEMMLARRAEQNLGPHATTDAIVAEMERTRTADTKARVVDGMSDVTPERKLVAEPMQNDLKAASAFAREDNQIVSAATSTQDQRWSDLQRLGMGLDETDRVKAIADLNATPGIHLAESAKTSFAGRFAIYSEALESLRKQFIPDVSIHLTNAGNGLSDTNLGTHAVIKPGVSMIALRANSGMATAIHEFGHAVFAHRLAQLPDAQKAELEAAWREWQGTYMQAGKAQDAALARSPVGAGTQRLPDGRESFAARAAAGDFKQALADVWDDAFPTEAAASRYARYYGNFDEFSAEQFAKFVESHVAGQGAGKLTLPERILETISYLINQALDIFRTAKDKGLIKPDASFEKFFVDLLEGNQKKGLSSLSDDLQLMSTPATKKPADFVNAFLTDPDVTKFGLSNIPLETPEQRAHAQAVLALHKKAEAWEVQNPYDAKWEANVKNLADNNVFNVASTGLIMLKSKSPLVRMLASELLEDASGVAGKRNATAAISKFLTERLMKGNVENDVEAAYGFWNKDYNLKDELVSGGKRAEFNKLIASEIEARRVTGKAVSEDPNIKAATDSIEAAYTRIANEQKKYQTLGYEGLPSTSVGYMPHRMSPKAVMNLTNEQRSVLHSSLVDQFVTIEGWDLSFSDRLASEYIKRVRDRASGDYGTNIGGGNASTASVVEDALRSMSIPEDVIKQHMDKFTKGAAGFTKGRIELDLNRVYDTPTGPFRLLDIFDTDQISLVRSQAGRASGDVALTKFGVKGKPGLKLLRDAMTYGENGKQHSVRELEAFDQIAAEFMNEPFGTHGGKWMDRATSANTLVRLGGIAFNQLAESINGIFHVGALRTWDSITSIPRLRAEIIALSKGEKVENSIIGSIEHAGGAEFGTDAYKFVMPYDNPDHLYPSYGQDTLTLTDRLLRGGGHLQSKISGWRLIHSAQNRGMAEQITRKMMRYVKEGGEDIALRDMGLTPELQATLKAELPNIATFGPDGQLQSFDITKMADADAREAVIQTVWRGTHQIIQGTFIGERGKWAHDGWLKMLTQFRTFSLTSMEKQWGRQRNQRGEAAAYGMLMGSMSIAAPVYIARVYASSIGRPDQEKYIEERLEPQALARATLNYVALSGMAGDFLDLTSSLLPESMGIKPTGGRSGVESSFVGNYVLPAASLVDDAFKYAQSPTELDELMKIMPGSRIPFVLPLVNATKD